MNSKNRAYYDCKAEAKPFALFYCLLLDPNLMIQSDFTSKSLPIWLPLYRVEKILANSNYRIRKVRTNCTECVNRIKLRPVIPQSRVDDLPVINFENVQRGPSLSHFRGEQTLFDESIPFLLQALTRLVTTRVGTDDPQPVIVSFRFSVAPAPVPAGLSVGPAPVPPPTVTAAPPQVVLPDPVENEVAEPPSPERPIPIEDVHFSNSSDDSLPSETLRCQQAIGNSSWNRSSGAKITSSSKTYWPAIPTPHFARKLSCN